MSRAKKRWITGLVLLLGLAPTAFTVGRALAGPKAEPNDDDAAEQDQDQEEGGETPADKLSKKKKALLAGIPKDETVLINVTAREMPASPDILNLGRTGARALARCVSDNVTDRVRAKCANMLARLGDRSALPALQGAVDAWEPSVRSAAIDALRRIPDASSFEPLRKILERDDLQQHWGDVLLALGALSDTRAMKLLRDKLHATDDKWKPYQAVAFRALWKSRHLMARSTLVGDVAYALKSKDDALSLEATYAASELRAPDFVEALVPLMQHPNVRTHNRAVYALGRIGNKDAKAALLAQMPKVREARMLNNIAFALERLDPTAFYATAGALVSHKQAAIRMNAAFVIGDVRRPEGVPYLKKSLEDTNDYVRVSAAAALGKLDAPGAIPLLEPLADDKNPALKEQAVYSLLTLSHGKRTDLVHDKLLGAKDPATRHRALLALAKAGDQTVAGDVMKCLELSQCTPKETSGLLQTASSADVPGRLLLAWSRGNFAVTDLVASRKPAGTGALAVSDIESSRSQGRAPVFAIDLAGDVAERSAEKPLRELLKDDNARLRLHSEVALSRLDVTEADLALFADLDNLAQDRLPAAARLLSRVQEPAARKRLDPELEKRAKGGDIPIALAAAAVRLEWDPEQGVFRFLEALASARGEERDLAERYLVHAKRAEVTWVLRRALAREPRDDVRDRLRKILDLRGGEDENR